MIVDNFAGGGGASTGIELALGRPVDLCWNHDPEAVAMHRANHPETQHFCQDVFDADPLEACGGRPVGLAWFSPDCKHFSKAKGGKPRSKRIRGLAWVVVKWAATVRPRVIILENVEEFQTWGPLRSDGSPCPKRKGRTFANWCARLRNLGYVVEWRELRGCDYGAPTIRKRLFLVARCDGRPVVWPEPTHGAPQGEAVVSGRLRPWRTAAECIDWTLPCPSIFERQRPLAAATCRRIARGIMRYVVNCAEPFIVPLTHHDTSDRVTTMGKPMPTVTGANREELALVAPVLTEHANASAPRCNPADAPLRTQCANVKGGHFALVSAFLAKHYGGHETPGWPLAKPLSTATAQDHHALVTGCLVPRYGERIGQAARALDVLAPAPTVVPTGNGGALVAAHLTKLRGTSTAQGAGEPLHTVSAQGGHFAEVRAFLVKYYGNEKDAHQVRDPMGTVTTKDRFGLVTVRGIEYEIADIGMRMLTPRELFRAQGFPDDYVIGDDGRAGLTLTKTAQVRMCGNSVCPPVAQAVVAANVPELSRCRGKERVA